LLWNSLNESCSEVAPLLANSRKSQMAARTTRT
jgi:hypothetical protein